MNRMQILMVCLFAVALGTGLAVGMGISHNPPPKERDSWLVDQLKLTPEQSKQMKEIWSAMMGGPGRSSFDKRHEFAKERDEAIFKLIPESAKPDYQKIVDHYNQQVAELSKERDAAFQAAVEKTKAILNDTQRAKYDEIMKKGFRGPHGGPGGPHEGDRHDGPHGPPPETQPGRG
jgi:Spy/CpxP family protein refolding chaperone